MIIHTPSLTGRRIRSAGFLHAPNLSQGASALFAYRLLMARSVRGWLYLIARLMGDVNAVKRGRVGRFCGRRVAGNVTALLPDV